MATKPVNGVAQNGDDFKLPASNSRPAQVPPDTTTVNKLLAKARKYQYTYSDSSFAYASKALAVAKKINYKKGSLDATYLIGVSYFLKGDYQKVLRITSDSLKDTRGDQFLREKASYNKLAGMAHGSMGSYQPALDYFMKAEKQYADLNDEDGVFKSLNNIGVIYLKLENYKQALGIFLKLDSLKTLSPSTISIPVNLGYIYFALGNYDKAEKNLNRVLHFKGKGFDRRALALSNFKMGEIYRARKKYSEAIHYFNQSIEVYNKLGNSLEQVNPLNGIALTYLHTRQTDKALSYAKRALTIADSYTKSLPQRKSSAETLYEIYVARHNPAEALKYHVMFKTYSDSLLNDKQSKEIGRLEAKNEFEKQNIALKEQQKRQNLQNQKKVAEQRTYLAIASLLFLAAAAVGFLFYRNSKLRKKANMLLEQKNYEIKLQADRLAKLNNVKNNLFSIISHDLRGPLGSLQGIIELYEINTLPKEEMKMIMPKIAEEFKYISDLLNNLLTWSKS